jgi:hypothetical protein
MRKAALALAFVVTAVALGCLPMRESDEVLLREPSFHIMVSDSIPVPATATFDFATKVYRIEFPETVDLALLDQRLIAAIEAELCGKDFRRAKLEPQILVSFALAVDSPISAKDLNAAYADDFPIEFPAAIPGEELSYHRGALIVDFVDRAAKKLLWRGAIFAGIDPDVSDDVKKRRIREAVRILLAHFPQPILETAAEKAPATS